jgi:hypothetical protein
VKGTSLLKLVAKNTWVFLKRLCCERQQRDGERQARGSEPGVTQARAPKSLSFHAD